MFAMIEENKSLVWREVPTPEAGPGEVRIRVRATAANRGDLVQRAGHYPPPPGASPILGLECAGEIDQIGEGVTGFHVGQAVCALLAGGGYAQRVVCDARQALPLPRGASWEQAAAIPEVFATAWLNVWEEGHLRPGERVLVHAGGSGVGTAAIQLLREAGHPVGVTVGRDSKAERCEALGAWAVNRKRANWRAEVERWTEGNGVDVILDPVGGGNVDDDLAALAPGGRLVLIGLMGGRHATVDLGRVLLKRLSLVGSTLRSRSPAEKGRILQAMSAMAWPLFEAGRIAPVVDRIVPIEDVEDAHAAMGADATFGKVVFTVA